MRSFLVGATPADLEKLKRMIRDSFPAVRQISTSELWEWQQREPDSILLVDVRAPEEFAVSHLPGALNLQTTEEIAAAIIERKPARTVLYCSVGYRSSRLASALAGDKLGELMNLEGSIFEWANEGRPVFRGAIPVSEVHPYAKRCAGLLKPGLASER